MPRLDMIGITCHNIPLSIRFYRLLGIDVAEPASGEKYVEATLPGGVRISWNDIEMMKEIAGEWIEPRGHRMGVAFLCDSPTEVDLLYSKIVTAGYKGKKEPWDAVWGQRYAIVEDPDGNDVDLFAPLT